MGAVLILHPAGHQMSGKAVNVTQSAKDEKHQQEEEPVLNDHWTPFTARPTSWIFVSFQQLFSHQSELQVIYFIPSANLAI